MYEVGDYVYLKPDQLGYVYKYKIIKIVPPHLRVLSQYNGIAFTIQKEDVLKKAGRHDPVFQKMSA